MRHLCKKQSVRLKLFCLCLSLVLAGGLLERTQAQVLYGTIVGNVRDATGAAVPGATVTATQKETNQSRETVSNETGGYNLPNLQAGTYAVKVSMTGFKEFIRNDVAVTANTVTRIDVIMEVGQIAETVNVAAEATPLQTDKADVHVELTSKEITTLPLSNYRNYQSLINLVPGATPARFQNAIIDTPARALTTNINGTNRNSNITRLDGAINVYIWLPHHTVYVAPSETVEAVNVVTNNFDAEQGLAGGAAITVQTKSGTNELHGSLFAYHDNNRLRARNFFFQGAKKPLSIRNIDGFTLGGPIKKDKLFFFGGWEGTRERVNRSGLFTVPTIEQRQGNFSALGTAIYDPQTGNPNGSGRTPFPNNIIPPDRINAISRRMQDRIPLPNLPGTSNNFFSSNTQRMNRDNYDVKINFNRTNTHQIWGKYSLMNAEVKCAYALGPAGGPGLCDGGPGTGHTLVQLITIGHNWSFGPRFVVDGNFGYTRMGQNVKAPDFGTNFGLDVLGIPGTNGPDIRQSGMPIFAIGGYTSLGNQDTWEPLFRNDESFTGTTNFSWIRGTHDMRWGFDVVRHHLNHWQPEIGGGPRGRFSFDGAITGLQGGASPNQFNAYAAFLLGLPQLMQKSLQFMLMTGREWQFGWFFRDRWQATRNLTLTLGLRYEYYPLMTRDHQGIERLDLSTMRVLIGGRGNVPRDVGITVSKKLFAPRVGLAYRLGDSTVIRSGYGITYDPIPFSRPLRGFYPLTINQNFVGANSFIPFRPIELGIPEFTGPDISSGIVDLPPTVQTRSPWPGLLHRGYIQSWNLIVERKLPGELTASVGYVGTQTVHQLADRNVNSAAPGGGNTGRFLFPQFGRTADTDMWDGWLSSNYHALQTTVNRQFARGLFIKGAYTYSKAINWADDDGWAGVMWNHPSVLHRNRARAGYDIPHIFQLGFAAELPFGRGKTWASDGGAASALLGGWQINGIFSSYKGRPFTVGASGASLNAPGNAQTADQVNTNVTRLGNIGTTGAYYDPSAFVPVRDVRFGTTGRNILRGPGVVNLDLSLFRTFALTERVRLEFRAEGFNISNTPHFSNPRGNVSEGNFLVITSAANDERQFRFALRLGF